MDVKRIIGFVLLGIVATVALVVGFQSEESDVPDNSPYFWLGKGRTGIVAAISPTSVTIKADPDTLSFEITNRTKFTSRGTPGMPTTGSQVQVRYSTTGGHMAARQVRLLAPAPPVPAPPTASAPPAPPAAPATK